MHVLIFFEGAGRNGKGAICRLIEYLLESEKYSVSINPPDVECRPGASERNKRLQGRLRGVRFCFCGESVGQNLDWTLLKTLTGGDTLAGAKLYQDESGFTPTHTLVLSTNERPKLPPTVAFKGRLIYVPFRVSFQGREDLSLESDMRLEAAGLLWKLMQLTPRVFTHGIEPPAIVREAVEAISI